MATILDGLTVIGLDGNRATQFEHFDVEDARFA